MITASETTPVVLITGCSSGTSHATARWLLDAGWRVWATARDPVDITDLADAGCRTAALDVTDDEQSTYSRLRGLVDTAQRRGMPPAKAAQSFTRQRPPTARNAATWLAGTQNWRF